MVERWIGALQRESFETTDVPWFDAVRGAHAAPGKLHPSPQADRLLHRWDDDCRHRVTHGIIRLAVG